MLKPGQFALPFGSPQIANKQQTISVSPSHGDAAFVIKEIRIGTSAWRLIGLKIEGRSQPLEGPFDPCPMFGWIDIDVEYHSEHEPAGGLCHGMFVGGFADPADTTIVHRVGSDTERNITHFKLAQEQAKRARRFIIRNERRQAALVVLEDISSGGGADEFQQVIDAYLNGSRDALEAWLDTLAAHDDGTEVSPK